MREKFPMVKPEDAEEAMLAVTKGAGFLEEPTPFVVLFGELPDFGL